ncbi:MAG: THUMP domain-containing protein, partial [Coriobacteriales bacterium]|nr:THUMP domain-containing protein [Coriobacteriales bacterium]
MAARATNSAAPAASAAAGVPAAPAAPAVYEFLATCAKGAEAVLARELRELDVARGAGDSSRKKPLKIRPLTAGVAFFGDLEDAYRALLHLSVASRVLLILERVDATDADALYAAVRALPWEQHVAATGTIAVDARGTNDQLRDERFMALKVKDAVCDCLVELFGVRPSVKRERPNVRINVALRNARATIALDLAGEPLHRRGYRTPSSAIVAPLRETLAATMLRTAGWGWSAVGQQAVLQGGQSGGGRAVPQTGQPDEPSGGSAHLPYLLDPLCGSGTIVIEAALMELGRPCGLLRDYWGFEGWLGHDTTLWESLIDAADEQVEQTADTLLRQRQEAGLGARIFASDVDPAAVAVARESAKRAGVADFIQFATADVASLDKKGTRTFLSHPFVGQGDGSCVPEFANSVPQEPSPCPTGTVPFLSSHRTPHGLLVTNPPYGERLATSSQLPALYAALGKLQTNAAGTLTVVAITPDDRIDAYLGGTPAHRIDTFNGPLETAIRLWPAERDRAAGDERGEEPPLATAFTAAPSLTTAPTTTSSSAAASTPTPLPAAALTPSDPSSPFANRLHKMATHRGKWARRSGVSCYRVYDADLPDYAVAIDLYQGAV